MLFPRCAKKSEWKDVENGEEGDDTGDKKCCDQFLLDPVVTSDPIPHIASDCTAVQPDMN